MEQHIDRTKYPQLNYILWDIHEQFVQPQTAFTLYERRWAYIEQNKLQRDEKILIHKLTNDYGNGHFLPSI